jgi:general secretion pathway protein K
MVKRRTGWKPGVALLATLLAVALMMIVVMDFTTTIALGYRSAADQLNGLRAHYLARSAVEAGLALLGQQASLKTTMGIRYDSLDQPWAAPLPPVRLGGGSASLSIVDEARKLDINLLINQQNGAPDPLCLSIMTRLFTLIGVSPRLLPAIIDWLDRDNIPLPGGAEAEYYLRLTPPYEPRNGLMPTIADLRMVRGVDSQTFAVLRKFLTVYPEPRVNANTAPPEVLAALTPELAASPPLVHQIIAARTKRPFKTTVDVVNLPGMTKVSPNLMRLITTQSAFFSLTGVGTYDQARKFVYSTFRESGGTAFLAGWREN